MKHLLSIFLIAFSLQLRAEPKPAGLVSEFAFGGIGFAGVTSDGGKHFQTLIVRDDNLEQFVRPYATGNNQAKMYAMVGFYYLDPTLYKHIRKKYARSPLTIECMSGCSVYRESIGQVFSRIEKGAFVNFMPEKIRPKKKSK